MQPVDFAVIGNGWRAEFFLRIADLLPDRFRVCALLGRRRERAEAVAARFGVPVVDDLGGLAAQAPRFVVTTVPWAANPALIGELLERKMVVLSETPPAPDLDGLLALWERVQRHDGRVQVAEQVWLRPHHQAQLALCRDDVLGRVNQAQVSVAHGYHGISLLRRMLDVGREPCRISARRFTAPMVAGAGRAGPPEREELIDSQQDFGFFDYGDRLGLLDFTGEQYFGWIRDERLLLRGERGELRDHELAYLADFRTPVRQRLVRHENGRCGDLQGKWLAGYQCGDRWLWRNRYPGAPLSDDELAITALLDGCVAWLDGGPEIYSLADGCHDHYLNLLWQQAIASATDVQSETMPWSDASR